MIEELLLYKLAKFGKTKMKTDLIYPKHFSQRDDEPSAFCPSAESNIAVICSAAARRRASSSESEQNSSTSTAVARLVQPRNPERKTRNRIRCDLFSILVFIYRHFYRQFIASLMAYIDKK